MDTFPTRDATRARMPAVDPKEDAVHFDRLKGMIDDAVEMGQNWVVLSFGPFRDPPSSNFATCLRKLGYWCETSFDEHSQRGYYSLRVEW